MHVNISISYSTPDVAAGAGLTRKHLNLFYKDDLPFEHPVHMTKAEHDGRDFVIINLTRLAE